MTSLSFYFSKQKDRVVNCTSNASDEIDIRAAIVDFIKNKENAITVEEVSPSFFALQGKMSYSKKSELQSITNLAYHRFICNLLKHIVVLIVY